MKKTHVSLLRKYAVCFVALMSLIYFDLTAQNLPAGSQQKLTVNLDVNDDDGVLYHERMVQSFLEIKNNTADAMSLEITWRIFTDDWRPLKQVVLPTKVEGGAKTNAYCPLFEFPEPGFYRISGMVSCQTGETYRAAIVIGIDPTKISQPLNPRPDFDTFWESSLKELATIAPDFKVLPQKREGNTKTNLFKVEMKSFGGLTVRGWLEVPQRPGVYPALLRVPGYQGNMEAIDKYDDLVVFSFNPRDHGESDDMGERNYAMWTRGLESKENYFYRGLYLDCIRAVDFLANRKDVDRNRIAIWGGSQGGGLSFFTAALDQRIALCIADIPFLCDWQRYFEITHWDEIDLWFDAHPEQTWQSMLQTLSYFDTKNMAKRITCPVVMGIGLQDDVCPPATSFVTYNHINSTKEYTIYKYAGHNQPESHYENRFRMLRKLFGMK